MPQPQPHSSLEPQSAPAPQWSPLEIDPLRPIDAARRTVGRVPTGALVIAALGAWLIFAAVLVTVVLMWQRPALVPLGLS